VTARLTTAQLKAFAQRDRRMAAYAAEHWNVHRCVFCGKCLKGAMWHAECEEEQ
jgi:hypothetical protein